MTRQTLAWLAIDLHHLSTGVTEEPSEEERVQPFPVVSGDYRDGDDTL
jgi:hypothetical protein